MKLKKYQLVSILEQCKKRGLTKIDEILEELKEFKDTDTVVKSIKDTKLKNLKNREILNER